MRPLLLWLLGAALIGCGGAAASVAPAVAPPAPAVVPAPEAMAVSLAGYVAPICPEPVAGWPWARELFPGCPPPSFARLTVACAGDCPVPCHVERVGGPEPEAGMVDAARFPGAVAGPPAEDKRYCTRSGTITQCRMEGRHGDQDTVAWATHGEGDRIVSVKVQDRLAVLDYAGGRVTAIRERDDGDDPRPDTTTFTYDEHGRLASAARAGWGSDATTRYRYYGPDDLRPWTVIEDHDQGDSRSRTTTTFQHDPDGRPLQVTRLVEDGTTSPRKTVDTYSYDCPAARPFADALVVARAFRDLTCMCRDPQCAVRAARDGERWRRGGFDLQRYLQPTDGERAGLDAVWRELDACVWSAAVLPKADS